jgi:hypothetical protein
LPHVVWLGTCEYSAEELVGTAAGAPAASPSGTKLAQAMDWLAEALAGGPRPSAELYAEGEQRGFSAKTLDEARKRQAIDWHREGFGATGRSVLSLPEPSVPASPPADTDTDPAA